MRLASPLRRRLLQAAGASGLLAAIDRNRGVAQVAGDYRALVCIFQEGGNDGENMLVRYDTQGYQNYSSVRTPSSGLNIPQAQLLPIQPARSATPFGFHPACQPFKDLFDRKQLAVVANVGVLAAPVTKPGLETQGAARPVNLFSHPDQQRIQSSADSTGLTRTGWGGRMADRLDAINGGNLFPSTVAMDQWGIFTNGASSVSLTVPVGATLQHASTADPHSDALAEATMQEILGQRRGNIYDTVAQIYAQEGLASGSVVTPLLLKSDSAVRPFFANLGSYVANQLLNVALLIEGRSAIGLRRQLFYVRHSGYDTHGSQPAIQQRLLGDLAAATAAFHGAMGALGLGQKVTSFTLSDFGRTFKPAAGLGTDHGWGNYTMVIGGAVKGGDFYGTVPAQALDGPDDLGKEGRWIPTTSLEQYGATLARWFGIAEGDLPYIFPNIGAFANTNLGFMT
jgi:uncharacterized protein (DUF1501 family)